MFRRQIGITFVVLGMLQAARATFHSLKKNRKATGKIVRSAKVDSAIIAAARKVAVGMYLFSDTEFLKEQIDFYKKDHDFTKLLARREDDLSILTIENLARFRSRDDTFGFILLRQIEAGFNPSFFVKNAAKTEKSDLAEIEWVNRRVFSFHDLVHIITGYPTSLLGEMCVLGFTFGQQMARANLFLGIAGLCAHVLVYPMKSHYYFKIFSKAIENGQNSKLLIGLNIEDAVEMNLVNLRETLHIPKDGWPAKDFPEEKKLKWNLV